ncbi:SLC52A3 [Lepeophtheirus salmonis]|uniref:Riboflavin transporter n=1 Tax=Lepeophtheirus salmonis TaxID=72036 RepID=A0A7R8CPN2_LEPSM|nr:SLC52A3 [Lepeophtheirus salmonis]CAF2853191.1 SLC52A3 [Lepeophtheirus salmonis]
MLFVRNRNVLVDLVMILFGISSWISINGLWVELPLIVNVLPENWNLPSYLVAIVQLANLGPIIYSILRWKINVNNAYCIYFVLAIGVLASFIMIYIWDKTVDILGAAHSLGLFIPIFLLSLVDCTSSVLYFPYVGTFKSTYLNSYLTGEGLSGFIPSIVALSQGIGKKTTCEKFYNETSQEWATNIVYEPPNFSVEVFFYFLFGMMLVSLASFMVLDLSPFARSEKISESELTTISKKTDSDENQETLPTKSPTKEKGDRGYNNTEIWFLLGVQGFINFFSNGILPSIQSYSCLPYGNHIFHFVVTAGSALGPTVAFLGHFFSYKSLKIIVGCVTFGTIMMGLIFATAVNSPSTMFDPSISGPLVVILWILNGIFFHFSKIEIAGVCRDVKSSKYLFWYGVLTQVGSALGALKFRIEEDNRCCITKEMWEKELEEVMRELKLLQDEKEKMSDRFERVSSLATLKTKLIEHRKKVEMLTVEELTKAHEGNLLASQRSRDHNLKELKIKLEIEKMKLASEKFVEDKVSQPSNDKETPREDTC